jgi:Fe-S cluster assembly protein SufD
MVTPNMARRRLEAVFGTKLMATDLKKMPMGEMAEAAVATLGGGADRTAALARYADLGWPNARTEAWKFTDLGLLARVPFQLPANDPVGEIDPDALPIAQLGEDACRVVIVNGQVTSDLSVAKGVPGLIIEEVAAVADLPESGPFVALNTSLAAKTLRIQLARVKDKRPLVHLVFVSAPTAGPTVSHARVRIEIEAGAEATIIESHVGLGGLESLSNTVVEIEVGRDAILRHYKTQNESGDGFHIALADVAIGANATYENMALQIGARLARNEIRTRLDGAHGECRLFGAYLADGDRHVDNTTFVDHAVPDCSSREVYKGVLADSSRGVFQGKILVRKDAQRTDGHQMNRGLLLSRKAEVNAKPELEIYADDVKCSHGATIGELEDDQLFYLQARGINRAAARRMLVGAYVDEVIDEMSDAEGREAFRTMAADWMAQRLRIDEEAG